MSTPPTGAVTFLFTDIEGSTRLWEQRREVMPAALALHDQILRQTIEGAGGYVFKTVGDAFCVAFASPPDAVVTALAIQRALLPSLQSPAFLRVRIALHTGIADERDGDYFGPTLNRVARLLSAGHGGQILLSRASYELTRDHLPPTAAARDLGEHRLKDLGRPEHVFQLVASDLPSDFPPLRTLDSQPNNLPTQPTPFIGREDDIQAVRGLLLREDVRLVTLTGPGGSGKTRLGLQVAAELLDHFPDGVYLVDLAPIRDANLVLSTIAQTLDVREQGGRPLRESALDYLRLKNLLLVLDNFEQVGQAAPLIADLLAYTIGVKALVTSRAPLHIRGEHDYTVPPLPLPDLRHLPALPRLTQYEAVRLFVECAAAVKADFKVTNENAPAVAEICYRLDGLPLAIELAAARVRLLSPQAMLIRLAQRLKFLTGGARDLPQRQQTLRNTIEWSHQLLEDEEQTLFRRLAVFVGGAPLDAIEAVCNGPRVDAASPLLADPLEILSSLVEKNLLGVQERDGDTRFTMLQTIHEYAAQQLEASGESEAMRRHHAEFFLALVEQAEPALFRGADQVAWVDRLDQEHDNLRAALNWGRERREIEFELRLAGASWRFWYIRGHLTEGRGRLEAALGRGSDRTAEGAPRQDSLALQQARAKALTGAGSLAWARGDFKVAADWHAESLALYRSLGDTPGIAFALNNLGVQAQVQGDYTQAETFLGESLKLYQQLGDTWGLSLVLGNLGLIAEDSSDLERARRILEQGLALARDVGDKTSITLGLLNLGETACFQGDYEGARRLLEEGIEVSQRAGYKELLPAALIVLGRLAHKQGDLTSAAARYRDSLTIYTDLVKMEYIPQCLEGLAAVYLAQGQAARAARLLGATEALREAASAPRRPIEKPDYEHTLTELRAQLERTTLAAVWDEGRAMTLQQTMAYAMEPVDG